MKTLYVTARSPFARRVRVALRRLEIPHQEEVIDVFHPPEQFKQLTPLGLIPVFILDNGETILDSSVIIEALHDLSGNVWSRETPLRWAERKGATLASGVMTALVSRYLEKMKKAGPDQETIQEAEQVIHNTYRAIEQSVKDDEWIWMRNSEPTQAGWDLGVALDYTNLRYPEWDWKMHVPTLSAVFDACQDKECFRSTVPPPA